MKNFDKQFYSTLLDSRC